ncbi:phage integrase [Catenovulum agarivorans DS-2]|uniref:Phage integrase n=1 Tax=Catenovulum agarivorans DS-2 TaxID=1328313 RepID=W7QMF5_9ALTE|nr:integrase arm-type DNA-binding domain-containing protein [Catenovulum agarivorans]EWH10117.1 phage integrase [Catenovulum agarivorans DS-2]
MRAIHRLSAKAVENNPKGQYEDGGGLRLIKNSKNSGRWLFRFTVHKRRREMGLGSFPSVSLKQARELASKYREQIAEQIDPIKQREKDQRAAEKNMVLFKDVALDAFESKKAELRGDGKNGRWFSPLAIHVIPKLGSVPISEIDQIDIRNTLSPIWATKSETARQTLNRLNIVFRHAAALGLEVDLQAVDKAKALLGKQSTKVMHIPSMPWQEVPQFYGSLDESVISQLALKLLILTGLRSTPVRFLRYEYIDFKDKILTVPAELMKGREGSSDEFKVPLTAEAIRLITLAKKFEKNGYLFANSKDGVISDATMATFMKRAGLEYRPHGFRSSLRDWIAETTNTPHEIAEMMLAHKTDSKVVRAYRRTDYIDQRRELLNSWGEFLLSAE